MRSVFPYRFWVLILFSSLLGCDSRQEFKRFSEFIEGTWGYSTENGLLIESWQHSGEKRMDGFGYIQTAERMVPLEKLIVRPVYYQLILQAKPEGRKFWVYFVLTESTDFNWVFENKEHDFPQRIEYRKISEDSLLAVVSGIDNGKFDVNLFKYKRLK